MEMYNIIFLIIGIVIGVVGAVVLDVDTLSGKFFPKNKTPKEEDRERDEYKDEGK